MKIFGPLDGSKVSEAVLKPAAELVQATGAEVHLIQVVKSAEGTVNWGRTDRIEPHSMTPTLVGGIKGEAVGGVSVESKAQADGRLRQYALDCLEHILHEYSPNGGTKSPITSTDPAREISSYTAEEEVNMIALTNHGGTGPAQRVMGSVAGKLLPVTRCAYLYGPP